MAWPKGRPRKPRLDTGQAVPETPTSQTSPAAQEAQACSASQPSLESQAQKASQRRSETHHSRAPTPVQQMMADPRRMKPRSDPVKWKLKARPEGWDEFDLPEDTQDRFHIPQHMIPEGMDLQWVTHAVMGQEMPHERRKFENTGWTPVYQEDFDGLYDGRWMPRGAPGEITQDGMVLMARPLHMSIAARERDKRRAQQQIQIKESAWKGGDIKASGAREAAQFNKITKSYERIDIPSE